MSTPGPTILERLRLYGARGTVGQALRALVRVVYRIDRNIIFIIPDFPGREFEDSRIKPFYAGQVERDAGCGDLTPNQAGLLDGFLAEGSQGIRAEIEGCLAGYAWVQHTGEYHFGRAGKLPIPPNHAVVKNLFVLPRFRGLGLGQSLNEARLSLIPTGHTPVAFIVPVNRYAVRNWEVFGFERVLEIRQSRFINGPWRTATKRLSHSVEATALLEALEVGNRD